MKTMSGDAMRGGAGLLPVKIISSSASGMDWSGTSCEPSTGAK
jgi:hypothetical protein